MIRDSKKEMVSVARADRSWRQLPGKRIARLSAFFICLIWLYASLLPVSAHAEGIEVRRAELHLSDDNYQLSVDYQVRFNPIIEQALEQGIPLYFVSEFTLTHPRWYWFDEVIAQSEQVFKLSYSTLTQQYRITRGSLFQNFTSLDEVLRIIEHQVATPIPAGLVEGNGSYISEKLFGKSDHYVASARLRLDVSQLPKPLQVNALASDDWNFDSDWYRWIVHPGSSGR